MTEGLFWEENDGRVVLKVFFENETHCAIV